MKKNETREREGGIGNLIRRRSKEKTLQTILLPYIKKKKADKKLEKKSYWVLFVFVFGSVFSLFLFVCVLCKRHPDNSNLYFVKKVSNFLINCYKFSRHLWFKPKLRNVLKLQSKDKDGYFLSCKVRRKQVDQSNQNNKSFNEINT